MKLRKFKGVEKVAAISIIVPIYKVEKYIKRCVDSILNQTFNDFELILVNDGSPDNCGQICDNYAILDNRVKVIHKKNGGLADARNAGLDLAEGEYIGFVDADDYVEDDMYEKLVNMCIKKNADISVCGRYDVNESSISTRFQLDHVEVWNSEEATVNLLTWNNIDSSACDKLYNKRIFNDIRFPLGRYNEDIFVMTDLLNKANKIVHIGECKYYYCHRQDSITTESFNEKSLDMVEASEKVLINVSILYPTLKKQAESFYYKNVLYTLSTINNKNLKRTYRDHYNSLQRIIFSNISNIILNKHISTLQKILGFFIVTNTYNSIRSIKKKMQQIIGKI